MSDSALQDGKIWESGSGGKERKKHQEIKDDSELRRMTSETDQRPRKRKCQPATEPDWEESVKIGYQREVLQREKGNLLEEAVRIPAKECASRESLVLNRYQKGEFRESVDSAPSQGRMPKIKMNAALKHPSKDGRNRKTDN